jgi:hypothetical protein
MRLELLRVPPISGSVAERHFDVSGGANTWVRFEHDEEDAWVGVFGSSGLAAFEAAVPFADDRGQTVLVISGGQGYVVNSVSGSLIRRTPWDYSHAAIPVPGHDFVLAADTIRIWAVDRTKDRLAWRRDRAWYDAEDRTPASRVALDGIVFDQAASDHVSGKVWEADGWYAFVLRVPDLEFERGEFLGGEWDTFLPVPPAR